MVPSHHHMGQQLVNKSSKILSIIFINASEQEVAKKISKHCVILRENNSKQKIKSTSASQSRRIYVIYFIFYIYIFFLGNHLDNGKWCFYMHVRESINQ